ncbi:cytochrome c [Wenzhouxiangellaceae bacterium CH-27]|uniref:Cytochrome c n=2 Tax=Elongatibacter sediminis TaxID=3119006 RepID=A0AAW9RCZ2_9GAMM
MKNMTHALTASTLCVLLSSLPLCATAAGDPASGQSKAATCEACHGKTGESVDPNYPNLAGQHESYLIKALSDYRAGRRTNAVMASFAANLSNQDIEDLAAWYASQDGLKDLSIK